MRIGLDIDGVLANYVSVFDQAAKACGFEGTLDYSQHWVGLPLELRVKVQNYVIETGLIKTLPVYPDAVDAVGQLHNAGHTLICITARGCEGAGDGLVKAVERNTWEWLSQNNLVINGVVFALDKLKAAQNVGIQVMVEDCLKIAESLLSTGIKCFLVDRPWNGGSYKRFGDYDYPWRIRSLAELPMLLG